MNLDQIANIAEIIGVVLVVVTLAFLTVQIRQNTLAIRATTMKAAMQSEMEFAAMLLSEAGVWERLLSDAPFTEGEETRKCILLFNVFMIDTESRFHQYTAGFLDAQAWEGRYASLSRFKKLSAYGLWRTSLGGMSRSADFLELMDNLVVEEPDDESE